MNPTEKKISIHQVDLDNFRSTEDLVAVEEPMEIRLVTGSADKRRGKGISITMRTPGHDHELAIGFLVAEGVITERKQIQSIDHVGAANEKNEFNTVRIELTPETQIDYQDLLRHFYTTSSCGVCGKSSLDALEYRNLNPIESDLKIDSDIVRQLPDSLRKLQDNFQRTGGIHAAGLFNSQGEILEVKEDVGRHNALDKLVGTNFLTDNFPLQDSILVVSGRASFELLQKALVAQIPIFVAVGAPSSMAVDLALHFKMTLIGFASTKKFNIYSSPERVKRPIN